MANTIPISMATVRSINTVRLKVVIKIIASLFEPLNTSIKFPISLIFQATRINIPASVAMGIRAAHLPANTMIINTVIAWMIPATGILPPFLILVAVLAIAPVAGIPPKIEEQMLANPCAINSVLER